MAMEAVKDGTISVTQAIAALKEVSSYPLVEQEIGLPGQEHHMVRRRSSRVEHFMMAIHPSPTPDSPEAIAAGTDSPDQSGAAGAATTAAGTVRTGFKQLMQGAAASGGGGGVADGSGSGTAVEGSSSPPPSPDRKAKAVAGDANGSDGRTSSNSFDPSDFLHGTSVEAIAIAELAEEEADVHEVRRSSFAAAQLKNAKEDAEMGHPPSVKRGTHPEFAPPQPPLDDGGESPLGSAAEVRQEGCLNACLGHGMHHTKCPNRPANTDHSQPTSTLPATKTSRTHWYMPRASSDFESSHGSIASIASITESAEPASGSEPDYVPAQDSEEMPFPMAPAPTTSEEGRVDGGGEGGGRLMGLVSGVPSAAPDDGNTESAEHEHDSYAHLNDVEFHHALVRASLGEHVDSQLMGKVLAAADAEHAMMRGRNAATMQSVR
jgi:hypothetical protein